MRYRTQFHSDDFSNLAQQIAADATHPLTLLVREKIARSRQFQAAVRAKEINFRNVPKPPTRLRYAHLVPFGITSREKLSDEQVALREIQAALWRLNLAPKRVARLKPHDLLRGHLAYLEAQVAKDTAMRKKRSDSCANLRVHWGRHLCLDCRRVNAHSHECARSQDRQVVLPRAARVPRHDASNVRWKQFAKAMSQIGTPPGKAIAKAFA